MLDAVDRALQAGFLTERESDGRLRFTHILVRDTSTPTCRCRAVPPGTPPSPTCWRNGNRRTRGSRLPPAARRWTGCRRPGVGVRAGGRRAGRAGRQPHEAARLWEQAIDAYDRAGAAEPRERLTALLGLGRALAVTGRLAEARRRRAEAISAAESVGDPC
ncbi:hypothetical protein NKG94_20455 [Micromonospora sp. M12]